MSFKSAVSAALLAIAMFGAGCRRDDSKKIVRQEPPGQLTKATR